MSRRLRREAMVGVTAYGIGFAYGQLEIEFRIDLTLESRVALCAALASQSVDGVVASGVARADAEAMLEALAPATTEDAPAAGLGLPRGCCRLAEAVVQAAHGERFPDLVATAEELLWVPPELDDHERLSALRAFVAADVAPVRLAVYGFAASHGVLAVHGDLPDAGACRRLAADAGREDNREVTVYGMADRAMASVQPAAALTLQAPERLAVATIFAEDALVADRERLHVATGHFACPNLSYADEHRNPFCSGAGSSPGVARRIAAAEGVERFAAGDVPAGARWAAHDELSTALPLSDVVGFSERQYAAHRFRRWSADAECLWLRGRAMDGAECWVPAAAALYPHRDRTSGPPFALANSSGVAAGPTLETACSAAAAEAIERDAFMWTWINGVARERIDESSLPGDAKSWLRFVRRSGWSGHLVNLTLDLLPVVLAVAVRPRSVLLGAACRARPHDAARAALRELVVAVSRVREARVLAPEDVETAEDHQVLYDESPHVHQAGFMWTSRDTIPLEDLPEAAPGTELATIAERIAPPVIVDLSTRHTHPLAVVRVIAPGLIPMSFGYDREPLGVARLAAQLVSGRASTPRRAPLFPHPFA